MQESQTNTSVVIPAQAGIHVYRDVGSRAASGTGHRGEQAEGLRGCRFLSARAWLTQCLPSDVIPACARMAYKNHWIPACAGIKTGAGFLGRLFQTRLYHLHPCRRACACLLQAGRNDGSSENDVRGGINVLKGSE